MSKTFLLGIALILATMANAQTADKAQLAVQQTIQNMFATLTTADTSALKSFVTRDVRFYEYGQVWPLDTLIQKVMQMKSTPGFTRTNSFEFVSTTIRDASAWATYYLQSAITRNGKAETVKWMETVVLVKEKQAWKVAVLHSTNLSRQ